MRTNDVIVIGGGLAGLTAAITAAGRGRQVTLMTAGVGALAIGGGTIDLLGYLEDNTLVDCPRAGLSRLAADHPYTKAGNKAAQDAVQFFLALCEQEGFAYTGSLDHNQWLPTAAGTLKPSCLVPLTMDTAPLIAASHVLVVGFARLKDYFPELMISGLSRLPGYQKKYQQVVLDQHFGGGRDVTTLDVARWLDTTDGQQIFVEQLNNHIRPSSVVLIPPILGLHPDYDVKNKLERELDCTFIETVVMPTAITGMRLRAMLLSRARKLGVRMLEQAHAARVVASDKQVTAVVTSNIDRERTYQAQAVVLATGGFFGGGITAGPDYVEEAVLHLPVKAPVDRETWGHFKLFGQGSQPFAKIGIQVDAKLRPVDDAGQALFDNVFIAGRNLAGYDYCQEISGNGVALVTGYKAGLHC